MTGATGAGDTTGAGAATDASDEGVVAVTVPEMGVEVLTTMSE